MCYNVSQDKDLKTIVENFQLPVRNAELFEQAFHLNGFNQPYLPVISNMDNQSIDFYKWKLIPEWVEDEKEWKANTLNARSEELFEKPAYKNYWNNRCLIICTGFFEPHYIEGNKQAQTYYVKPKNNSFFTFGGIFSKWKGIFTMSIIMIPASPFMAEVHNVKKRMPLILEENEATEWVKQDLSKEEMKQLMKSDQTNRDLAAYQVRNGILNSRKDNNNPEAIEPFKTPIIIQGSLFD